MLFDEPGRYRSRYDLMTLQVQIFRKSGELISFAVAKMEICLHAG
jgi:hypothetical protein